MASGSHSRLGRLRRRADVLVALTRSDLKIRYGRGYWQLVNWFVNPFAQVGIYVLLRLVLSREARTAPLSVACAVVPFQILVLTVESSMSAVSLREPVLLNRWFDRVLMAPSTVMTESVAFGASFALFPITMVIGGVAPGWHLLWLPVVMAVNLLLALGLAWPATLLGTWYPSLRVIASQVVRILFFAASGIIALREMSPDVARWVRLNPLTGLFESYRRTLLYNEPLSLAEIGYPAAVGLALTLLFAPVFRREQRHFAKLVRS